MIEVSTDSLTIHLSVWLYRLRMCQAHLEQYQGTLEWDTGLGFVMDTVNDLLGACEDASAYVSAAVDELQSEADLGEEHLRRQHAGGSQP